jgi:Yip1-like protein
MSTTMAPPAPSPEPQQPSLSTISRIFGVFFSPKPTFADIVKRPSWVAPMIVLLLISIGLSVTLAQRVNWYEVSKEQIAKSKFASSRVDQLSDDLKERVYEQGAARGKMFRYVRGFIGWPLLLLLSSAIYLGVFKLIGGARVNYGTAFAICTFAHLPVGLRELLAIPVNLFKEPNSIDPENFLASNPAAMLAGSDLPTWQMVPLAFLDIFGIWVIVLAAIGFSAADPKKLPFGKALGLGLSVWAFFLCFFTGLAWIFS